jgi:hypothetical protein
LQKGDRLYLITDGFADQFGGEKGKKYKRYHLEELLNNTQQDSLELQKNELDEVFENWKKGVEQVDDVKNDYWNRVVEQCEVWRT